MRWLKRVGLTFYKIFISDGDMDAERLLHGVNNVKRLYDVVFISIQSTAILAALNFVLEKKNSYILEGITYLGYSVWMLYLSMSFRYFFYATCEKLLGWAFERPVTRFFASLVSLGISISCVVALPKLVAEFVRTNFIL